VKIYLPSSLGKEIEYWQKYRAKYIAPQLKGIEPFDIPVSLSILLLGKKAEFPLEVNGYMFHQFLPLPSANVIKNTVSLRGKNLEEELGKIENAMSKWEEIVERNSPSKHKEGDHYSKHSTLYGAGFIGKIVGELISAPIPRDDIIEDDFWLRLSKTRFDDIKTGKLFGGPPIIKQIRKRVLRPRVIDFADIYAHVVYYEDNREYFGYTPTNETLDIIFFDIKRQKELTQRSWWQRFLRRMDEELVKKGIEDEP